MDREGLPIAWYTYSALAFIEPRLSSDMTVFEFGAGHSTLWWATRVDHVSSVESDLAWVDRLRSRLPSNTDVRHESAGSTAYARSASAREERFSIIVIDGAVRNQCAFECISALAADGIVIWDNADREALYADGFRHLTDNGFRRLDFDGLGPLNGYGWRTTIFYRPNANCLGI